VVLIALDSDHLWFAPNVTPAPDEVAALRAANARLHEMIDAKDTEILVLREQVEALTAQLAELRARLAQSSRNSSRPPSSEGLAKPAPVRRPGLPGHGHRHRQAHRREAGCLPGGGPAGADRGPGGALRRDWVPGTYRKDGANEADRCLDWRSTYLLPYIRNLASFVNVEQQWQLNAVK
jgi:Family of unknown function (DUF6444)